MKHRVLPLLSGFALAALIAELLLHALPVSTGYNFGVVDADHPMVHGLPHFRYTYSKDWSFHLDNTGALNNYGFRAAYDYSPNPRALVIIGNSFIQADALDPRATIAARLGALLDRPAYAVGVDGFSLADYLEAARWANTEFDARTVLILLTTGDLSHSCVPQSGAHYLRRANGTVSLALIDRPAPSSLKRWLNESKLFRYIYDNLRAAGNWSKGWRRDDDGPANEGANAAANGVANPRALALLGCTDEPFEAAATQFLLQSFHDFEIARRARVIFLLAPGYRREQLVEAGGTRDVDRFAQRAALEGFEVVRLDAAFAAALGSGTRLDFLPIDGHWNGAAHAIAARVAAEAISPVLEARLHSDRLPAARIDETNQLLGIAQ
jgi:hypothetical protein